ncbi:MAG: S8 family serine peptidase [Myxococcota bacterium]
MTWLVPMGIAGCGGADMETADSSAVPLDEVGVEASKNDAVVGPRAQVLFESIREEDEHGLVVDQRVRGELQPESLESVARPLSAALNGRELVEDAWAKSDATGRVTHGYRVMQNERKPVSEAAQRTRDVRVGPALADRLQRQTGGTVTVVMQAKDFPAWNIPQRVAPFATSMNGVLQRTQAREQAFDARRSLGEAVFAPIRNRIASMGGRAVAQGRTSNWLTAELPVSAVQTLVSSGDIENIDLVDAAEGGPHMSLGSIRQSARLDADRFLSNGYTGERANPDRHSHGDIVVGVIEIDSFDDEACFLADGASCTGTSRLRERYNCDDADGDGNYCEAITNFTSTDASHGTVVSSIIGADNRPNRAGIDPPTTLQNDSTGIAPEVSMIFFGNVPNSSNFTAFGLADAFDDAVDRGVDITNSSWGWDSGPCTQTATQPHDIELEDAFDDGVLNVVSAGNPNVPGGTTLPACNMRSPADLPKSLSVNSLAASASACSSNYNSCLLDQDSSATGGLDARVGSSTFSRTIAGVDLVAPNDFTHATFPGNVVSTGTVSGTSVASPVVAGAAALVKDWQLAAGNTWINSPGRLHTMMLAMGDRHRASWGGASTSQGTSGSDPLWGLGKLRLRLFASGGGLGAAAYNMHTVTLTASSPDHVYVPFDAPIATGSEVVKCVMMQDEDMSGKNTISRIELEMRLRQPVNGSCASMGAVTATRIDSRIDYTKMGAIEPEQAAIGDRCLEVTLDGISIDSGGITTHTMCYYADRDDDQ